jgi:hypothetical protein
MPAMLPSAATTAPYFCTPSNRSYSWRGWTVIGGSVLHPLRGRESSIYIKEGGDNGCQADDRKEGG